MCLPNVLDKALEMGFIFPSLLIILEIRVEQWFMKLVLVLFTLAILKTSAAHATLIILDAILLVR